jgi:hypothetical protein
MKCSIESNTKGGKGWEQWECLLWFFFHDSKSMMYPPKTPWKDVNQSVNGNKEYSLDFFMAPTSKVPPVSAPKDASSTWQCLGSLIDSGLDESDSSTLYPAEIPECESPLDGTSSMLADINHLGAWNSGNSLGKILVFSANFLESFYNFSGVNNNVCNLDINNHYSVSTITKPILIFTIFIFTVTLPNVLYLNSHTSKIVVSSITTLGHW